MQTSKRLIRGVDEQTKLNEIRKILICFPYAGGGASAYNSWKSVLENDITVCPVQLPGREERIMDEPYRDMEQLVKALIVELWEISRDKIYLFGHSMGGKIAYEVAKGLEERGRKVEMLIVSGSRPPHIPEPNPIFHLPDEEFILALKKFQGMPDEILEDRDLLNFFLPMLRADFEMDESYVTKTPVCLKCPIVALGGSRDPEATEKEVSMWKDYTCDVFEYRMFEGSHFFIKERQAEVIDFMKKNIKNIMIERVL